MKSSLGPLVIRTSIALACLAVGPRPFAAPAAPATPTTPAAPSGPQLHISGRSLDEKGTYAGPVDIYIERWSTDDGQRRKGIVDPGVDRGAHRPERLDDTSDGSASQ